MTRRRDIALAFEAVRIENRRLKDRPAGPIEALPENDMAQVEAKRRAWEQAVGAYPYRRDRVLADLWTAAFFAPKTPEMAGAVPTSAHLRLVTVPR